MRWSIGTLNGNTRDVGEWRGHVVRWLGFEYAYMRYDAALTQAHADMNEATRRYRVLAGLETQRGT